MMDIELLLLGLLMESPRHGYQLKRTVNNLSLYIGSPPTSIYYSLKSLEKENLVRKYRQQQFNKPARIVYEITKKGERRFKQRLLESFIKFERPYFNLDLCLYFSPYLNPPAFKRHLKGRIMLLRRLSVHLENMLRKSISSKKSLTLILRHNLALLNTEINFLQELLSDYNR